MLWSWLCTVIYVIIILLYIILFIIYSVVFRGVVVWLCFIMRWFNNVVVVS